MNSSSQSHPSLKFPALYVIYIMSNWFKLVKRVLRSPSKAHEKKSSRRREECEAEEEEKKREKKRWLLGRSSKAISSHVEQRVGRDAAEILEVQTRHALAAAAATVEAAAATAEAAAEIVKLAGRPCRHLRVARDREHYAAVIIQAAFRGYLARRAFHALRGLVKLQALVRGHNVRKQTKVVLKYMQALVRVQERLLHQQRTSLKSHDTNSISWESKHQILRERSRTMEGRRSIRNQSIGGHEGDHEVFEDRAKWLDGCPPSAPWDNCNRRASADNHYNYNFSTTTSPIFTKRHQHYHEHHHKPPRSPLHHRAAHDDDEETTPSPLKTFRTSYSAANTPALPRLSSCMIINANGNDTLPLPNYMAFTESAKAKARSSPAGLRTERGNDGSTARKRLSYYNPTAPETTESLRSPSFKSLPMDRDYSNYYSVSQILSPCSTTDLRWLN